MSGEPTHAAAQHLRQALARAARGLVDREVLVDMVALGAIAGEHVLVVGPPGTAKSEAVRRVAAVMGARFFEYILSRFTEPSEIFGPVDLRRLREGIVATATDGMLPEADVALLDEVFLGSTAILNTLLGILNERVFRRGATVKRCPLRICVGATNGIPGDEVLAAFADRFLIHVFVEPIADPRLEELMEGGRTLAAQPEPSSSLAELDLLAEAARAADVSGVRARLAHAVRLLRAAGVALTDRRVVKLQALVAAAAVAAGRRTAGAGDLWPIVFAVPTLEGQQVAREALRELLAESQSASLPGAAAEASQGPLARAAVLAQAGRDALAGGSADDGWKLRLESVVRAMDAAFLAEQLPTELREVRARIVAELGR